jgi:hypothetical protein
MTTYALTKELVPINLPLASIFLDPNNPRFVGPDFNYIPDGEIASEAVQHVARQRLINDFSVEKLQMNMEVNGYLPIDRIIVRKFDDSQYVILEGNRRICAAKLISKYTGEGDEVSPEVLDSLKRIPCLEYVGTVTNAAWIFQGLRHITGINDWSSFNKAKLLVEQMEEEGLKLMDVGKRFGLTPHGAGQWVRGYYAFKQAREKSDFISEVDEKSYTYFQELFSKSSIAVREWMKWDEEKREFTDALNFNEFVSWLYPRPEDMEEEGADIKGDWELRILRRRDDIRQVGFLLREDKEIFEKFRRDKDIERAYSEALSRKYEREARESANPQEEVLNSIRECIRSLGNIPFKMLKDPDKRTHLMKEIELLEASITELKQYA